MSGTNRDEIVHRELDTDDDTPAIGIVKAVADLEGKDVNDLETAWDCIDGVLTRVFSNPPAPEAQLEVTFSYEGYRITVEQNGTARFVETR